PGLLVPAVPVGESGHGAADTGRSGRLVPRLSACVLSGHRPDVPVVRPGSVQPDHAGGGCGALGRGRPPGSSLALAELARDAGSIAAGCDRLAPAWWRAPTVACDPDSLAARALLRPG